MLYRCVAPNQRGYSPGARPTRRRDYRTTELVGDIEALIDALGADRVHLVGHDWGAGLPPAWIGMGTMDLLFDEDVEYAKRLRQHEVPCALDIVPGAFHGFDLFAPNAGVSRHFFESQCAALLKQLTPP